MVKSCLEIALLTFVASASVLLQAQEKKPAPEPPAAAAPTKPVAEAPKAPAKPDEKGEPRNIRFQFEGIPYMDLVQRFAQMGNKPLLSETNVDGTVTFNDPKPYTYPEAFETLNTILSMKNVMLVETDHYLKLVPFKELPQMPLKIFRGLDKTGDVRGGEVVTVVLELQNLEAGETAKSVANMLSNAGSVAPLTRGKGLIITDRLENIKRIKQLIAEVDSASPVQRQMKTYTLLHSSGAVVADLINKTFGASTAPKKTIWNEPGKKFDILPPDPDDYITAIYDDASRTLVMYGPAERITLAEDLIKRFEEKEGGSGGEVKIYYPRITKVEDLARMIRQAIPGVAAENEAPATSATKARVIVDSPLNRLIVTAPIAGQLDSIENLINKVERGGDSSSSGTPVKGESIQLTKIFRLQAAEPAAVYRVITNAFTRRLPNGELVPTIKATLDDGTKTVVVTGSPGDVQHAAGIIEQMDNLTEGVGPLQTAFIEFGTAAELRRAQPLIKQLYENQVLDSRKPGAAHAKFLPDMESKRLIVTANDEHIKIIRKIAEQLKTPALATQPREFRAIALKNVKVEAVYKSITDLVTERMSEEVFKEVPKPLLLSDVPNNRLLITANAAQLHEIEEIVKTIDIAPTKVEKQLTTIPLQNITVAQVLPTLTQLLRPIAELRDAASKPEIIQDSSGKQLIISAAAEDTAKIKEIVATLDKTPTRAERQIVTVPLQNLTVPTILPSLTQLIRPIADARTDAGSKPEVMSDATGKQLIVSAVTEDIDKIKEIIRQLDGTKNDGTARQFKTVKLYNRAPAEVAALAEQLYKEQLKGQPEPAGGPATFVAEAKGNRVIVVGSEAEAARAEAIIRQLDPALAQKNKEQTRVIRLRNGVAADLAALVEKSLSLEEDQIKVLVDTRSNALVVSGSNTAVDAAVQIIDQLDAEPNLQQREIRLIELRAADAKTLTPVLTDLFTQTMHDLRGATYTVQTKIVADANANRLIVTGTKEELAQLGGLVQKLDQSPQQSDSSRVFKLNSATASEVAKVLAETMVTYGPGNQPIKRISVSADDKSNSVIVAGPRQDLQDVAVIIEKLDGEARQKTRDVKVVELQTDEPAKLITLAQQIWTAQAQGRTGAAEVTLTLEPSGKRVIIVAPPTLTASVEQVIIALDQKPDTGPRNLQVIELKQKNASTLLPLITRLYEEQEKGKKVKAATIMPDASGMRLLVYGSDEQIAAIKQISEKVENQNAGLNRQTKFFDLGNQANADRMQPMIRQLYQDQVQALPDGGTGDAQFLLDPTTARLIVSARQDHLALIDKIVQQLMPDKPQGHDRQTKMFEVGQPEEVTRLLPLVQQLYKQQTKDNEASDPPDAQILADERGGRLIVTARQAHLDKIEAIISQLLANRLQPKQRETRIYNLNTTSAAELSSTVKTIYAEELKKTPSIATPQAVILPDAGSNRLIVSGPVEELTIIEGIIKKLDEANPQSASTRTFQLKSISVDLVASVLSNALVRFEPSVGRRIPRVSLGVDASNNSLIVSGDTRDLNAAASIVDQLDKEGKNARQLRILPLKAGKAADLATRVKQLYTDQIRGAPDSGPADALIIPEPVTDRLIITARENQMQIITDIVTQLDGLSADGARELRTILLKSSSTTSITPLINQLFGNAISATEPAQRLVITPGLDARTLFVEAPKATLEKLQEFINGVEKQQAEKPARDTRIYNLTATAAADIAQTVNSLYSDEVARNPAFATDRALILPDPIANRLIVSGPIDQLEKIESMVKRLDEVSEQMGGTRVFKLKSADATQLSTILSTAMVQINRNGTRSTPRISVGADPTSNTLVISGEPKDINAAASIIEQLDGGPAPKARKLRVFPVTSGKVSDVVTRLRTLYTDRIKNQPENGPSDALIMGDSASDRLIVTANEGHLAIIEEILGTLDNAGPKSVRQLRMATLKNNSAASVATIISQFFSRQISAQDLNAKLIVTAAPDDHTLVFEGPGEILPKVEELVKSLDGSKEQQSFQVRSYSVGTSKASELAPTLTRMFGDKKTGVFQPKFEADAGANLLLVGAPAEEFPEIEKLIDSLKASAMLANEIRTFKLINTEADQIVSILASMLDIPDPAIVAQYPRRFRQGQETKTISVSAAPSINAVIVQGPPNVLKTAEQLIRNIDTGDATHKTTIQTVRLKKASAESIAQAVNATLASRGPKNAVSRANVTPVENSNSLLIDGPSESVQDVIKIIHDLDEESTGADVEIRIYKLENGKAKEISSMATKILEGILRESSRSGKSKASRGAFTVSADDRSNSLIVSAHPEQFKMIEQLLMSLDQNSAKTDRSVRYIVLKNSRAVDVAKQLRLMFENRDKESKPEIESDTFSNSITIVGGKGDIREAEEIIASFEQTTKDDTIQVRLLTINSVPADQMVKMLKNLYSQMSRTEIQVVDHLEPPAKTNGPPVTVEEKKEGGEPAKQIVTISVDRTANALLLSGPSRELDAINNLVDDLTWNSMGNDAEFRQFQLKEADPVLVARTLTELFKPEPVRVPARGGGGPEALVQPEARMTVVAEPRTRSIIVRAKATDFILLESLLQKLDSASAVAQLSHKLIPLVHVSPRKILPLATNVVHQLGLSRPGELISVTPDLRTSSLFVIARDTILKQVEDLVKSLDTPPAFAEAEVAMIPLKNAVAANVANILQTMLRPGVAGEVTPEARELQDQIRALRIHNDSGQDIFLDLSKPIKILPDTTAGAHGANRVIVSSTGDNLKALTAVIEMMDAVAISEGVTFRIVHLKNADASTVSDTLAQIFQQGQKLGTGPAGPAQPQGQEGKGLTSPLNVSPDKRSNSVVITGKPESIDLALRIIRDLDNDFKGVVTQVKVFRLNYASATRLVPMLQSVFAETAPVPGTEGLAAQVTRLQTALDKGEPKISEHAKTRAALTVQADDPANTLVVAARADMMPLIEDVVKTLDVPSASGLESVRIYPLKHGDANRLLKVISDIYSARGALLRPEDKPGLTVDTRTNALIVSGNEKIFAMIETLIAQLDRDLPLEFGEFRIIKMENADATTVAPILQRILDARTEYKSAANVQTPASLRAVVIGDPRINALIVGGATDAFELVQALAKELDAAGHSLSGEIRLIPLKNANAGTLSTSINALFTQRYQATRNPELQRTKPIVIPDVRMNALLVSAGVEDSKALDELLQKLDQKPEDPALTLTVIGLKINDSSRVASMLQTLFAGRLQSLTQAGQPPNPQEHVIVQADGLSNALVVSANKENLELIQSLVAKLDVEPEAAGGMVQLFELKHADAGRIATMLRSLISQGLYRPGSISGQGSAATRRNREAMAIAVDARSNSLIVSASPENLAILKELIKQLDGKDYALEGDIKLYTLKNARASQLATTLQQFFQAKRTGESQSQGQQDRSLPVTILADDRTNTLLITGGKEAFDAIDRMIAQLDSQDVFDKTNFRVFVLKNSTATKLQSTLTRLFQNRPSRITGKPPEPITVVADAWANALVIAAANEDMEMVSHLIETLDNTTSESGLTVQVLPLKKADARSVSLTVQGLYRETPGGLSQVKINVDERLNALVVSAGEADMKRITELVEKLDSDQVARIAEIRIFPLKYAQADELAPVLTTAITGKADATTTESPNRQSMLQFITRTPEGEELVASALKESVLITADRRRNALVVSAPVDSMNLLARIISTLDAEAPQLAKIKVFKLENADARQMAEVLESLFRLRQVPGQPPNTRAIQYRLERDPNDNPFPIDEEAASATIGSAEQYALSVTVDLRTNSLLLGGSDHYVNLASQIIQDLDGSPALERKSEVYRLRNAKAKDVESAIRTFLDQDRQRFTQTLGQEAQGTTQRLLEREVAIVSEPTSNTLLLSANPRYFEEFKSLIKELDRAQPQVLIQVILAEVTLDKTSDLGVEWQTKAISGRKVITTGTGFGVADQVQKLGGFSSSVNGGDFNFILRALENDGRLEVLSRPQILTADNQEATINVGQRVPLVTASTVTPQGGTINSFTNENVGVSLTVTPRISPDGYVKMEVAPSVSEISSSNVSVAPGSTTPIINQRRATTTVSVQSGQSVIIGGLISTTDDKRVAKVPFLGSIPYVGVLFRSTHQTSQRKELLIILTPQLLLNQDDADNMTVDQLHRTTLKDQFKRDKLQKEILDPLMPLFNGDIVRPRTNSVPLEVPTP